MKRPRSFRLGAVPTFRPHPRRSSPIPAGGHCARHDWRQRHLGGIRTLPGPICGPAGPSDAETPVSPASSAQPEPESRAPSGSPWRNSIGLSPGCNGVSRRKARAADQPFDQHSRCTQIAAGIAAGPRTAISARNCRYRSRAKNRRVCDLKCAAIRAC
jgi:hypothetical protein